KRAAATAIMKKMRRRPRSSLTSVAPSHWSHLPGACGRFTRRVLVSRSRSARLSLGGTTKNRRQLVDPAYPRARRLHRSRCQRQGARRVRQVLPVRGAHHAESTSLAVNLSCGGRERDLVPDLLLFRHQLRLLRLERRDT